MNITIHRNTTNRLYTEGELHVNGHHYTHTVEPTDRMLPAGTYLLRLVKVNAHCRKLAVMGTEFCIGLGHSFIDSRRNRVIAIGQPLIPGTLYRASPDYERLVKRLEKCQKRQEAIHLLIAEATATPNAPARHWLQPTNRGCPPTA